MQRSHILPLWSLATTILALGCIIPDTTDGEDGEDGTVYNNFPNNNNNNPNNPNNNNPNNPDPGRPTNPERDDPSSPNYRGNFEAILSESPAADLSLDADGLGEATVSLIPAMQGFNEAHCLISLIDREPDASGHTGYILFQYPGQRCPAPGEYKLVGDAGEGADYPADVVIFKSFLIEAERADSITATSYLEPQGTLTITSDDGRILKGELNGKLGMRSVDDARPVGASAELRLAFDAPYLEL